MKVYCLLVRKHLDPKKEKWKQQQQQKSQRGTHNKKRKIDERTTVWNYEEIRKLRKKFFEKEKRFRIKKRTKEKRKGEKNKKKDVDK